MDISMLSFGAARAHAVAIAGDRIAFLLPDAKAGALEAIDATLQLWKLEQCDADGMIELEPISVGLLGSTYPSEAGVSLADIAKGRPIRVSVMKLRPESCAGPFVTCPADLWVKLWSEKYERVLQIHKTIPVDVVLALLVVRDAAKMSADSLASSLRYVWVSAWTALSVYRTALGEMSAEVNEVKIRRTKQLAALTVARAVTAARKRAKAQKLAADAFQMAIDLFVENIDQTNAEVAAKLLKYRDFSHLSRRGMMDRIKGAQSEARKRLSRQSSK
jgi:hypothetical protein